MKNYSFFLLFFFGFVCTSLSQNREIEHIVGKTISLKSEILNQERAIQIYLPEDYETSKEKCPVVYVFDSQKYFLNAVAYQQNLRFQKETPGFIVVGIKTNNAERRKIFNSESTIFRNYLEKELLPFIDSNYRTLPTERVFFGWQRAASFGIEVFASKPNLFKGYFIASPTFLSEKRISDVGTMLDNTSTLDNYLYFTLGDVEAWSLDNTNSLAAVLKDKATNKLEWKFDLFDNENHYSTTIVTMHNGLKTFFKDYAPIRYYTLSEFKNDGGIKGLMQLFKKRGERYLISRNVHDNTKRYLFLLAIKENNYDVFTELDTAFPDFLTSFSRDVLFVRFGEFYKNNNAIKKAIDYYKKGIVKFPASKLLNEKLKKIQGF